MKPKGVKGAKQEKLMDLFFKVTSESLSLGEIGGSRREIIFPAGLNLRTEKSNYLNTLCSIFSSQIP